MFLATRKDAEEYLEQHRQKTLNYDANIFGDQSSKSSVHKKRRQSRSKEDQPSEPFNPPFKRQLRNTPKDTSPSQPAKQTPTKAVEKAEDPLVLPKKKRAKKSRAEKSKKQPTSKAIEESAGQANFGENTSREEVIKLD